MSRTVPSLATLALIGLEKALFAAHLVVDDAGVVAIADESPVTAYELDIGLLSPQLHAAVVRHMLLSGVVSDLLLGFLLQTTPAGESLRVLDLAWNRRLSSRFVELASQAPACARIDTLSLEFCTGVTSEGLSLIARTFAGVSTLNCAKCVGIVDAGWMSLANMANLTSLNVSGLENSLSQYAFGLMIHGLPSLRALDVSGAYLLTDLTVLVDACPDLETLTAQLMLGIGSSDGLASLDVQVHRLVELAALRLLDIRSNSVAIATVEFLEGLDLEARVDGGGALPN